MLNWKSLWISLVLRWTSKSSFLGSTFRTSILGIVDQSLIIRLVSWLWFALFLLSVGSDAMITLPLFNLQFLIPVTHFLLTALLARCSNIQGIFTILVWFESLNSKVFNLILLIVLLHSKLLLSPLSNMVGVWFYFWNLYRAWLWILDLIAFGRSLINCPFWLLFIPCWSVFIILIIGSFGPGFKHLIRLLGSIRRFQILRIDLALTLTIIKVLIWCTFLW